MTKTALILGATGNAGRHAAQAFETAGWIVRRYDRKSNSLTQAAMGVDVIVNAWNPPNYHNWAGILPEITQQVIAAAKISGARVVLPGNVYNFGTQPAPWSDRTPHTPCSKKGKIRVDIERMYREADIPILILRAGDFVASDGPANVIGKVILKEVHKGKITTLGPMDCPHAFAYLPDWARAVVELTEGNSLPKYADICFPGHSFSIADLKSELERDMGPMRVANFPWWMMKMTAPFWELAKEFSEMRYLYSHPHHLNGSAFFDHLPGFEMTDFTTVARAELPRHETIKDLAYANA